MLYQVGDHSGIYCVEGAGEARLYLVTEPEPVLIDGGAPGTGDRILRDLAGLGIRPLDVKKIILTHHHLEQTGGLWVLQRRTGARILAHAQDADYICGRRPRRPQRGGRRGWRELFLPRLRPVPVDRKLVDGEEVAGLRVLHTPGHTPGHICLLRGDVLFSGDLLEASAGGFVETPHAWTDDVATARASIVRVSKLPLRALLSARRPPYVTGAGRRVQELAARLEAGVEARQRIGG